MSVNTDDMVNQRKFAEEFDTYLKKIRSEARKDLTKEQLDFVTAFSSAWDISRYSHPMINELMTGLENGTYSKPSDYFNTKGAWLFGTVICSAHKEAFLYSVDTVTRRQCSTTHFRRSFRTSDYSRYLLQLSQKFNSFERTAWLEADIADILSGKLPENALAFINQYSYAYNQELSSAYYIRASKVYCDEIIAYELDKGNPKLEQALEDIIMGESEITLNHDIIRGIVLSRNEKMHELLCKLLLAARLQEGLRQAICENADAGTAEAFMSIFKTIEDNDLIRFSSVKRAVGTWTGLLASDSSDLERISGKTLRLIGECLRDEAIREKYLSSEDSMEIYIALWAYGFYEIKDAARWVMKLSAEGTHHQLLTAGYFAANVEDSVNAHEIAKRIISEHNEPDILAVYFSYFIADLGRNFSLYRYERGDHQLSLNEQFAVENWFDDREEAIAAYDRLWEIYKSIPKKELSFSPCIFPWYSASLKKSDVARKIVIIAYMLGDEYLDSCCKLIKEIDSDMRDTVIFHTLRNPRTDIQQKTLTEALSDKSGSVRDIAYKLIGKIQLNDENYLQIEDMLKYKAADMRGNLIALLMQRNDDKLYGTVSRLLADKKEEKRTAALDMVIQLTKDSKRSKLAEKCIPLVKSIDSPTTKEKILIESICGTEKNVEAEREPLYDPEKDIYVARIPDSEYMRKCVKTFMDYFPNSEVGCSIYPDKYKKPDNSSEGPEINAVMVTLKSLSCFIHEHRHDEYVNSMGNTETIGSGKYMSIKNSSGKYEIAYKSMWKEWFSRNKITHRLLMQMITVCSAAIKNGTDSDAFADSSEKYIISLYGKGFEKYHFYEYGSQMSSILSSMYHECISAEDKAAFSVASALWYINAVPKEDVILEDIGNGGYKRKANLIEHAQIKNVLNSAFRVCSEHDEETFAVDCRVMLKSLATNGYISSPYNVNFGGGCRGGFSLLSIGDYIYAAYKGILTERQMYAYLMSYGKIDEFLSVISNIASFRREMGIQVTTRGNNRWASNRRFSDVKCFINSTDTDELNEEQLKLIEYADGIYEVVMDEILATELKRGDTETIYSNNVRRINRIYGIDKFVAILSAMGNDTLERSTYTWGNSKRTVLSHLLSVCIPEKEDNADKLRELVSGTDITEKRIIEAAMYSPEWLPIIEKYLNWEGFSSACYYFIAHMNESFDDKRKAVIAKYTPLTDEELHAGAFDIGWFRSAYDELGKKRFDMIYDAAKYISDGAKHSRARKYADAVLGKLNAEDTQKTIIDKRNKDLLMAYALIPIENEDDICRRYLYLQTFIKESRKFGSQRSASEKKAAETAMQNLSLNAGYADVTRLTLRMETKLIEDNRELFAEHEIEDTIFRLSVNEKGKADIIVTKGGKTLKSVPAKLKKNEYIVRLTETKKKLNDQYSRTKQMFELAMESSTEFTVAELKLLRENPVVLPVIKNLVFVCNNKTGFLDGNKLIDYSGAVTELSDSDTVITAHPYALYTEGHWSDYQKYLFENQLVQPFRQVFRELYIKTAEEIEQPRSMRYSGNQIQPAKTAACLKSRRWTADVENGLQKVYYKENIIAVIYAAADWFSPADIEAPTLEWVEFYDRKTGRSILIKDIPDIIFSEVMRDVDLAVSVAHAGGVDPETSHSTVEMRAALIELTLPLFKLKNVQLKGNHAHIEGCFGEYSVHLGSGVIHKQGGAMINILAVHSQHRGKLFLPFADEDPKTAEIITKILLLAEDKKIKDPSILDQIK